MKQPAVYILAGQQNGTLYVGATSDLVQRIWQHKNDVVEGFTKKYGVHLLVYFELQDDPARATPGQPKSLDVLAWIATFR
jgi:putative endonuclease